MRVTRPRVLHIRRAAAEQITVGDEALAEFGPGLLRFLNLQDSEGRRIGEGLAPEWVLPLGAAATAATAVNFDHLGWGAIALSIRWALPAGEDDTLIARARVEERAPRRFGRASVTNSFTVRDKGTGEELAEGSLIFICYSPLDEDAPVIAPPPPVNVAPVEEGDDLLRLARPEVVSRPDSSTGHFKIGDVWEWVYPPDLLRLLMNPIAGGSEPLGRRAHPLGIYPLGAALHAALSVAGEGSRPIHAEVRWLRTIAWRSDFRLRSVLREAADRKLTFEITFFDAGSLAAHIYLKTTGPL